MANDVNRVSPSKYDIYEKLLDIAKNYTDTENTDYLKTGLFGYLTESMAMMMRDSSLQKAMLYNENNLNTAVIPSTVYNWAKMFNVDIVRSIPAYATVEISIPKENIASQLTGGNTSCRIDRRNMIIANDYYFSLEHSILIASAGNGNFTAKYDGEEDTTTSFQDLKGVKRLSVYGDPDINDNIIVRARAYQYKYTKIERQLSASTYMNKVQTFTFDDQFCGANLYIKDTNGNEKAVRLIYGSNSAKGSSADPAAYYDVNDNTLQVIFKTGEFIPAPNSRIVMYIYTTKGSNVPNRFSGNALFRGVSGDTVIKQLNAIIRFKPTTILGGTDMPSVEAIKQTVIRQISLCNTIVTESDLNNYFDTLTGLLESVNDGKVTFIKKRDDILRRVFSSYVLMRTGLKDYPADGEDKHASSTYISKCVPTNTLSSVIFPASTLSNGSDLAFPKIQILSSDGKYHVVGEVNDNSAYYFCPFYVNINYFPVKKIRYIYNMTDTTSVMSYTDSSEDIFASGEYANPISVRIYRGMNGPAAASAYSIIAKFDSNIEEEDFKKYFPTDAAAAESNGCTIQIAFGSSSMEKLSVFATDVVRDDKSNINTVTFKLNVNTTNEFPAASTDSAFDTIALLDSNGTSVEFSPRGRLKISIIKPDGAGTKEYSVISDDYMYLYRNLDDIMLSDMTVSTREDTSEGEPTEILDYVTIKDVPVVHSSYLKMIPGGGETDDFVEQLFTYIDLLKENLGKLETSTFFDLKFYNTYGQSFLYNTTNTNMQLYFTITLTDEIRNSNAADITSLKNDIRSYIRRVVDKSNNDGCIRISSIIALLGKNETYGQYIDHIDVAGVNGSYTQYIKKLSDVDESSTAPEWLNLDSAMLDDMISFADD